jgi:hypothetical protein
VQYQPANPTELAPGSLRAPAFQKLQSALSFGVEKLNALKMVAALVPEYLERCQETYEHRRQDN